MTLKKKTKKDRVKVAVRIRPLTDNSESCLQCLSDHHLSLSYTASNKNNQHPYVFDYVFNDKATQQDVYDKSIKPIINSYFDGYNATIFAYGQTGSGKTFTMFGNENNNGITPRVLHEIFSRLTMLKEQKDKDIQYSLYVSFLEIHNEKLRDLLDKDNTNISALQAKYKAKNVLNEIDHNSADIRITENGEIVLFGIQQIQVTSELQFLKLLKHGINRRATGKTKKFKIKSFTLYIYY